MTASQDPNSNTPERILAGLRRLPSVHAVLNEPLLSDARHAFGHEAVVSAIRALLETVRGDCLTQQREITPDECSPGNIALRIAERFQRDPSQDPNPHVGGLRPVLNVTGILLHTGLGRAPLAKEALDAIMSVAGGYCNLEIDLDANTRGRRTGAVADLLREITGAEDATVVNNNAAATVLTLRALAHNREVIVSRGQLVEIGGSFRLPEIFEVSGAKLREVGTTNKTRLADYLSAITPDTAALLSVHPSNYRIEGFTETVPIAEIALLAHSRQLIAIDDIGSGRLTDEHPILSDDEPSITSSLAAGADVVLCSGDKLLGGPQCGLILGNADILAKIRNDPLARALRVDKLTLAALEATLRLIRNPHRAYASIPLWSFVRQPMEALRDRALRMHKELGSLGYVTRIQETQAYLGGGSLPGRGISSIALGLVPPFPCPHPHSPRSVDDLAKRLRHSRPAVLARIHQGALLCDLRALPASEDHTLIQCIRDACEQSENH